MRINKTVIIILLSLSLSLLLSGIIKTYAGGDVGGKQETALNVQIDTKDLTGINLWIAEMYNNDRTLYAIVVTLVMATLGSVLAFGTDMVLKRFGMNVTRISHHE
jgi:hypothetical protein